MKKRILSLIAICLVLVGVVLVRPTSAHVLKTDGDIGGVLHINPDDNPYSGTPTTYSMAFKDTSNKFQLSNCGCSVSIIEDGSTLLKEPLTKIDELDSTNYFTFPKADVYTMQFVGTPKKAGDFQPFSLSYLVRVTANGTSTTTQQFPLTLGIGLVLGIGLLLLATTRLEKIL